MAKLGEKNLKLVVYSLILDYNIFNKNWNLKGAEIEYVRGENLNFNLSTVMGRPRKWRIVSAANARAAKQRRYALPHSASPTETTVEILDSTLPPATEVDSEDNEITKWMGGVNHNPETDNSDFSWDDLSSTDTEADDSMDESDNICEEMAHLERTMQHELQLLHEPTPYDRIMKKHTAAEWKEAEKNRGFGYTGNSDRNTRRKDGLARKKGKSDAKLQTS